MSRLERDWEQRQEEECEDRKRGDVWFVVGGRKVFFFMCVFFPFFWWVCCWIVGVLFYYCTRLGILAGGGADVVGESVAVCCSMLQLVDCAVCPSDSQSVLQCVAICCSVW